MFTCFLVLGTILGKVTETAVSHIGFPEDRQSIRLESVVERGKHLHLWSAADDKPHITFNHKNPERNWSFEFVASVPRLRYPQSASIYAWYTTDMFLGNMPRETFQGFVAGIEFVGDSVEVMLSIHENGQDKTVRDYLDSSVLNKFRDIRVKVIHTSKNMKVEIYHNTDLIYDHLRLLDQKYFGTHSEGGYLSITAAYAQVGEESAFKVSKIKLYKREEDNSYDPHEESTSISTHDTDRDEVGHVLASLEHFMKYIDILFGEPRGATVAKAIVSTRKDIKKMDAIITKLDMALRAQEKQKTKELHDAVAKVEEKTRALQREMANINFYSKQMMSKAERGNKHIYLFLALVFVGFTGLYFSDTIKFKKDVVYSKRCS